MDNKLTHRMFAAVAFLVSFVVYLATMAPTVSFWDCGEFVACSYKLAIPHPPGAPIYMLIGRFFSMIPIFDDIAARVNFLSVLSSALTVLLLHLVIVHLIKDYMKTTENPLNPKMANEGGFLDYVPYFGGLIGSLCFAFSYSFWFNAVEAEVYALSMFFTALLVWLILVWSDHAEENNRDMYILLIVYIIGISMGVHFLSILTLPFLAMIVYYRKYELSLVSFLLMGVVGIALTLFAYKGVISSIPKLLEATGFGGIFLMIMLLIGLLYYTVKQRNHKTSLLIMSVLLLVLGYSSFMMIMIRSNLDPNIDENDPETVEAFVKYINREQYGEHHLDRQKRMQESPNGNRYTSSTDFFWNYQVNEMYIRYFYWNFGGIEEGINFTRARKRADVTKFWLLPLLLGTIGFAYHMYRDWKRGLAVGVLFFMTGLAIVLYLNQPDPQPRERDYSYVGSFFAFSIWIGIGAAAILEMIATFFAKENRSTNTPVGWLVAVLMFIVPAKMFAVNYELHNRKGNFVASDYSYNMLINAEENGVIFTNGDNDTFPLWYLQEVEGVRTDVRVANLSLLNTSWYINQLKNMEPKVPIGLSDEQIQRVGLYPWPDRKTFEIPRISENVRKTEADRYRIELGKGDPNQPDKINFEVRSKMQGPRGQGYLRVQDYMILNILATNSFEKPIYFAVTSSDQNRLDGLMDYQRMDGLLFKITTIKDWDIDAGVLYDNLMNKFRYRNLNNPDVYYNENIIGLLQNYRSAFFRLGSYYLQNNDREKFKEVIGKLYDVMPPDVIPFTNKQFEEVLNSLAILAGVYEADMISNENTSLRKIRALGEIGLNYKFYDEAKFAYEKLLNRIKSGDISDPEINNYMRSLYPQPRVWDQASEEQRSRAFAEESKQVRRFLLRVYQQSKDYEGGIAYLNQWKLEDPNEKTVDGMIKELERLLNEQK